MVAGFISSHKTVAMDFLLSSKINIIIQFRNNDVQKLRLLFFSSSSVKLKLEQSLLNYLTHPEI